MDEDQFKTKIIELDKQVAILKTQLECSREARDHQAKEYERRLSELNHAHAQQVERNAEYVSLDKWEGWRNDMEKWRHQVDMWRWIAIGAGIAGGGITAKMLLLLGR